MRSVSGRVPCVVAVALFVLIGPSLRADEVVDPLQARLHPPVGVTSEARLQPPVGVESQSRLHPPVGDESQARIQPPGGDATQIRLQPPVGVADLLFLWIRLQIGVPIG